MDILDQSIYDLVHSQQGGASALAPHVNMQPGTLMNKANPSQEHQLNLREAITIQGYLRQFDILHAEATLLNHACIQLGDFSRTSDVELLNLYADYHAKVGDTATAIREALKDGLVSNAEVQTVRRKMFDDIRAQLELLQRLEGISE